MNALKTLLLPALILALTVGCGSDDGDGSPMGPSAPTGPSVQAVDGGLALVLSTDKASYEFGETVRVRARLTNVSDAPIPLDFQRGTPARYFNLNVSMTDADGVMQRAAAAGENDVMTLAPGASVSLAYDWDQTSRFPGQRPVERGVFELRVGTSFDDRAPINARGLFIELD